LATQFIDDLLWLQTGNVAPALFDIATDTSLSYAELTNASEAMCNKMLAQGVGNGSVVAIVLEKCSLSIVLIFATLRLGAMYVPLDETLPLLRLQKIFQDCKPDLVIAHQELADKVVASSPTFGVWKVNSSSISAAFDGIQSILDLQHVRTFDFAARAKSDCAYIMFTSGSTGHPKGVMVAHSSVVAFLRSTQELVGFKVGTRFLNATPLFFDASVVDIYATIQVVGCVFLLRRILMASELGQAIECHRISATLLIPTMLKMMLSRFGNLKNRDLSSLKQLWFGGEGCPISVLKQFENYVPGLQYIHGYGPTETTHSATLFITRSLDGYTGDFLPIGKPLPTIKIQIIDQTGNIVSNGETGELLIGGDQLMLGYANAPELTRQAFTLTGNPKEKYYKSGDLVRRLASGDLLFLGRNDDAIKVGGNLVHLFEIESTARQTTQIIDCVAVALPDVLMGNRIILFVVFVGEAQEKVAVKGALESKLRQLLPAYMQPNTIVLIDPSEIVIKATGKIDRQKLIDKYCGNHL
jgi:amino acid adenylation domain-containing protein